jgi:hypothetical protein
MPGPAEARARGALQFLPHCAIRAQRAGAANAQQNSVVAANLRQVSLPSETALR